ncbi:MAG: hypothetical protein IPN68_09840 [Bacteroidetes bacterium]|nr:hypothetical protein [Bacteroidota bacterium]
MTDQLMKLLLEVGQVLGILSLGVVAYLVSRLKKTLEKKPLFDPRKTLNKNLKIQATIQEVRGVFDADRVSLYQFHNGNYYVSGQSIQKLSLTHVVCRRGVSYPESVSTLHQNIPVSCILKTIDAITSKGVAISSDGSVWGDPYFKDLLKHGGVGTAIICAVRDSMNHYFGIIVVGWLSEDVLIPSNQLDGLFEFASDLAVELVYEAK